MACLACGHAGKTQFSAREMMFGTRESFDYLECAGCGSLQIASAPADLGRHYPNGYYSFDTVEHRAESPLRALTRRAQYRLLHFRFVSRMLGRLRPNSRLVRSLRYSLKPGDRILDVGCGSGWALDDWARFGFPRPVGVDPFISRDLSYSSGAHVRKATIAEMTGAFDVVMFNHSLEHVLDPFESLGHAARLLAEGGRCIVRLPTSSSEAFARYRENWVQLDPPRHLFVPSREGMRIIGEKTGLELVRTEDDSESFQFWGSEQYVRDVPLNGASGIEPAEGLFSDRQLDDWEGEAQSLNRIGRGDQAIFTFEKRRTGASARRLPPSSKARVQKSNWNFARAAKVSS